jgi:DNA-binding protein H-NS
MSDAETDAQPADAQPAARESKRRPAVDLDRMTVQELTALRDAAEAKRLEKLEGAKNEVLAETREKLAQLGLSLEAVLPALASTGQGGRSGQGRKRRSDAGQPLPARYRGPNGEPWSGRGRMPKWLQALEAEGRDRKEFQVSEEA